VEQGRAVLRDLAANPATATHVASKMARHFIADTPAPALVERMTKAFLDIGGDLKQVARTMVSSPEAWTGPPAKLKRPSEWVVGMVRATGLTQVDPARFTNGQALLGEPLWRPPSPKGFRHPERLACFAQRSAQGPKGNDHLGRQSAIQSLHQGIRTGIEQTSVFFFVPFVTTPRRAARTRTQTSAV
jgi:uncharacterized protein (DUF1800 family)